MLLLNVSPMASTNPGAGHWHWLHKTFTDFAPSGPFERCVTVTSFNAEGNINPVLQGNYTPDGNSVRQVLRDVRALRRFIRQQSESSVVINLFEGNWHALLLVAGVMWLNRRVAQSVVSFHWADNVADQLLESPRPAKLERLLRASTILCERFAGRLTLAAESERLGDLITANIHVPVTEYPVFSVYPISTRNDTRVTDFYVSPSHVEQLDLVVDAINMLAAHRGVRPSVTFGIKQYLLDSTVTPERIAALRASGFDVVEGSVSNDDYENTMATTRCVVLMYESKFYEWGVSARRLDAVRFGASCIVSESTAFASKTLETNTGFVFTSGDASSLADALRMALDSRMPIRRESAFGVEDCYAWIAESVDRAAPVRRHDPLRAIKQAWAMGAFAWSLLKN